MFDIAQQAEFIPGLREEITKAVEEEGAWSKAAIDKMLKLDSFVKESQRVHPHRIGVFPYSHSYSPCTGAYC